MPLGMSCMSHKAHARTLIYNSDTVNSLNGAKVSLSKDFSSKESKKKKQQNKDLEEGTDMVVISILLGHGPLCSFSFKHPNHCDKFPVSQVYSKASSALGRSSFCSMA